MWYRTHYRLQPLITQHHQLATKVCIKILELVNFVCVHITERSIRVFLVWYIEDGVFDDPVTIVNTKRVLSKTEGQPSQRWLYSHVHTIYEVIVPLCTTVLLTQYYQLWPILWWLVRLWQTYHNIVDTTVRTWCDHCIVFIYICCAIYTLCTLIMRGSIELFV